MSITFDPDRAREWLRSAHPDFPSSTVAEELCIADHDETPVFGWDTAEPSRFEDLVTHANDSQLFGPKHSVGLMMTHGDSCGCDGGIVLVDVLRDPGPDDEDLPGNRFRFRLAGLHVDFKHLTDDREAEGIDGAVAVLSAVAGEARAVLDQFERETRAGIGPTG